MSKGVFLAVILAVFSASGLVIVKVESASSSRSLTVPAQPQVQSSVRKLNLVANDLLAVPNSSVIYATVPSIVGAGGNTITPIDTSSGALGQPVPVGSEPGKMAISDDGSFVYVILTGAGAVRRFNVGTQTAGPQFTLGNIPDSTPFFANDITVAPGNPHTFAVHRGPGFSSNIAVFDDGVMRPTTALFTETTGVQFGTSSTRLYAFAPFPTPGHVSRLNVSSGGVVVESSTQVPTNITTDSIKFAAGKLYTGTGKVIDPEAGTIVGSFSTGVNSPTPFAVDITNNRAFYVSIQSGQLTVTAFDLNTFQATGSLTLTGFTGTPTSLVRWGGNGLAVSTSGGDVFLVQTDLVPSGDPVPPPPTPSPTPTPTPVPTPGVFIRKLTFTNNDIIYNASNDTLYAAQPSSVGATGNSITAIDPHQGTIGPSVFIGSEPERLAISDNGQVVYVKLRNETRVGRFEVATQSAGPKFDLVGNPGQGGIFPADIAVAPGSQDTVAVSAGYIAVFDNGVKRQNAPLAELDTLQWGDNSGRLYSATRNSNGGNLRTFDVGPSGVSVVHTFNNLLANSGIVYSGGKIYNSVTVNNKARIFDPETGALLGTLNLKTPHLLGTCSLSWTVPDPALNRVFTLCADNPLSNGPVTIAAFDLQTMNPLGDINVPGVSGIIGRMVRWGTNGLAFRTDANQLFIIQTDLISTSQPVPTPTPTPTATPTPTPAPTPAPGELRKLTLQTRQLVADSAGQNVFASVQADATSNANTITTIDPVAGTVTSTAPVGNDPRVMAISDDNQFIYVGLDGDRAVRRFDVATRTAGPQFSLGVDPQFGGLAAQDIAVMPGQPNTIAVARRRVNTSPQHGGVAIFDNGVQRQITTPSGTGSNAIEFSRSPNVLYGQNTETTESGFRKMGIASCGVSTATVSHFPNLVSDFHISNGLLFTNSGAAIDPETGIQLGGYAGSGSGVLLADPASGKVYKISASSTSSVILDVFDMQKFVPLLSMRVILPGEFNFPSALSLVRWGQHGLAFNTFQGVYLLENALIGGTGSALPLGPVPADPTYTVTGEVVSADEADGTRLDFTGSVTGSITLSASGISFPFDPIPFTFGGIPACGSVTVTPSKPGYLFSPASVTFNNPSEIQFVRFTAIPQAVRLTTNARNVSEASTTTSFTVERIGINTDPASVESETVPGSASDRSDFTAVSGRIDFAPGETSKTIPILLSNDTLVEGSETFTVVIKNPIGVELRFPDVMTVTILDNDFTQPTTNPLDTASFFVRQHYHDFLNREPDSDGLAFWSNEITSCGTDAGCIESKRINVSAAFFLSIEFQETGYLVYRMYKTGFGNLNGKPVPVRLTEFLRDTQSIGKGVQVGVGNWQAQLEANKQAYALAFVQRPEFLSAFPAAMTADQFVNQLDTNAGGVLSANEKADLIAVLGATPSDVVKRASVVRSVAEDADLRTAEFNKAFVLMQYFGYLRRNPDDAPDANFDGYNFWLSKLNQFEGNYVSAEMVKAFLVAGEYRQRFGP
ncbi:MAG TPA: Calx-beta domain-containing protein [Pyrinomonadaceae bacterium]